MQKNKLYKLLLLLIACFFYSLSIKAQASNASISVSTISQYTNGNSVVASNQVSLDLDGGAISTKVYISTNTDFINGSNSIDNAYVSAQVTTQTGFNTTYSSNKVSLTTSPQLVFSGTDAAGPTNNITFTYTLTGGTQLLVPAGTYSTTATFKAYYYDKNGVQLVGPAGSTTYTATLSIVITGITSLTLSGSAGTASLNFNSASVYNTGASLNQSAALTAFCNQAYHVTVKASQNLKYSTYSILISNVMVDATPSTGGSGITTPVITLSTTAQTLITSTAGSLSQNFDLLYYTSAGNTAFIGMPAGTYTTTLTYTITSP